MIVLFLAFARWDLDQRAKEIRIKQEQKTVKYFYILNIKLDKNTLNNRLSCPTKTGKIYKDYYFAYK